MSKKKTYIIDPLTTLCKVALLYFLPEGTRLAINNHVLTIQENTQYQWLERLTNSDNRFDISQLNSPIIKAIKWYIVDNSEIAELDDESIENIRTIANFTILGFTKMQQETYKNDQSMGIITQYFINLLNDALIDHFDESKCMQSICQKSNQPTSEYSGALSDIIKKSFDSQTIHNIAQNLSDAESFKESTEKVNALTNCIHQILIDNDRKFVNLMNNINTNL